MRSLFFLAFLAVLGGCSQRNHDIVALVDTARIQSNWPKFQNYSNQFSADIAAIDRSNVAASQKQRQLASLQGRYGQIQRDLAQEVKAAASVVAHDKNYQLIVTKEFVGYGGTDITSEVEAILKIQERPTPTP
ncbi:MAG: hypothetical protein M3160_01580 [Candidatus Eremiobacteraeota bacterium]|nr:hypothetical protein [Candidatus Eremiobacteraeota bacterium]